MFQDRGKITVKGKGEMITYWLENKGGRAPPNKEEIWPDFSKSALIEVKEEEAPEEKPAEEKPAEG